MNDETERVDESKVLALFDGMRTVKEIVHLSGYSRTAVHRVARRHGLSHYGKQRQYTNQKLAYSLRADGLSWDRIADVLGYSSGTAAGAAARAYMKRGGIEHD